MTAEEYIEYWAGSAEVGRCLRARFEARQELWLFLEYFPYMAMDWMLDAKNDVGGMFVQLCTAAAALRNSDVVHFDAHLGNAVTDGSRTVLTDFGLVCAKSFDLEPDERAFMARHRHYDVGVILAGLGLGLAFKAGRTEPAIKAEVDRICGLDEKSGRLENIMNRIDHAADTADLLGLSPTFLAALARYRDVNHYTHTFMIEMATGLSKDAVYDDAELLSRLRDADVPAIS